MTKACIPSVKGRMNKLLAISLYSELLAVSHQFEHLQPCSNCELYDRQMEKKTTCIIRGM